MNRAEIQDKAFKDSLLDVATGLSQADIQFVHLLHKDKIKQQCTCGSPTTPECITCPHHSGLTVVTIMNQLLERGVFSSRDTGPLVEMLERIGRVDLATRFSESYAKSYPNGNRGPGVSDSPVQRATLFHTPPRPSTPIPLEQLSSMEPGLDSETDFAASRSPSTPSHNPLTQHSPSPCSTPTHLAHPFRAPSPLTEERATAGYGHRDTEQGLTLALGTPTSPCCMCGRSESGRQLDVAESLPSDATARLTRERERFTQSECVSQDYRSDVKHLDRATPLNTSPTGSPSDSLSQEYTVVLTKSELRKVNQVMEKSSLSEEITQKIKEAKPMIKSSQERFNDTYEVINADQCPPICCSCQCQMNQLPPRALSLDNFKPSKPEKRSLPHQSSAPAEVSQSCSDLPECNTPEAIFQRRVRGHGGCRGACNHLPAAIEPSEGGHIRMCIGSMDSGMGSSQENSTSTESLRDDKEGGRTVRRCSKKDGAGLCEWRICRRRFYNAMFTHKNNFFDKKVSTFIGKSKSKKSVNLSVKLFPNGLDMDRGSSVTLTLDVIGMSHPNKDFILDCKFRGLDTQNDSLILTRHEKLSLSTKKHTLYDFLSHDIIKQSSARSLKFLFDFQLEMVMDPDWVMVDT